ncbi:MAG: hypothetical protein ACRD9S_06350 [Pyrinomonadaceae bacterium]
MGDGGGEIIIKGGSVEVTFDGSVYIKDQLDPSKHKAANRKITRIQVLDGGGGSLLDEDNKDGLPWTITVSTSAG